MRKCLVFLIFMGLLTPLTTGLCNPGKMDLDFNLTAPKDASHRSYLGFETLEPFTLNKIQAKILIIEIFSMYCPICQREAANVNKLFKLIQKNPKYKNKIKLIGIGAGNSAYEVNFFKKNYKIKFPLFSDTKFVIHKKIGEVGTPHFIGLIPNKNKVLEIFYSKSGEFTGPEEFLKIIIKASGLKF